MADVVVAVAWSKGGDIQREFQKKGSRSTFNESYSHMPPHPTFDDDTFNALEAYLKPMVAIE